MSLSLLRISSWLSKTMRWTKDSKNINHVWKHCKLLPGSIKQKQYKKNLGKIHNSVYNQHYIKDHTDLNYSLFKRKNI